jgi:hypothetical protein
MLEKFYLLFILLLIMIKDIRYFFFEKFHLLSLY